MNSFLYILGDFQKYVKLFQWCVPLYLLHEKQVAKKFLGHFLKPKVLKVMSSGLLKLNLDDKTIWMKESNWVLGTKVDHLLQENKGNKVCNQFMNCVRRSILSMGNYLLQNLPLQNELLETLTGLDLNIRDEESVLAALKKRLERLKEDVDADGYTQELINFSSSIFLNFIMLKITWMLGSTKTFLVINGSRFALTS